jgi:hypothetical protein
MARAKTLHSACQPGSMAANSSHLKRPGVQRVKTIFLKYTTKEDVIEMNSRSLVWVLTIFLQASQGNL